MMEIKKTWDDQRLKRDRLARAVRGGYCIKMVGLFQGAGLRLDRFNAFRTGVYVEAPAPYETQKGHVKVVSQVHRQA